MLLTIILISVYLGISIASFGLNLLSRTLLDPETENEILKENPRFFRILYIGSFIPIANIYILYITIVDMYSDEK